jgi:hypothetical protein
MYMETVALLDASGGDAVEEGGAGSSSSTKIPLLLSTHLVSDAGDVKAERFESILGEELDESKDTLTDSLGATSYWFLCLCGFVWKDKITLPNLCLNIWVCVVYILMCAPELYLFIQSSVAGTDSNEQPIFWVFLFALLFQSAGIMLSSYFNSTRLRRKHSANEMAAFKSMQLASSISVAVVIIGTIAYPCTVASRDPIVFIMAFLPQLIVGGANVHFLLTDARYTQTCIYKLIDMATAGQHITIADVKLVHTRVQRIVSDGSLPATAIMSTALVNLLCLFAATVLYAGNELEVVYYFFVLFFKEIVFAVVGLYYAGCANEASRELIRVLGARILAQPSSESLESAHIIPILNSLQACPIEFPVVGMVLTRKDVAFRFSIWCFGVLLSFASKSIH